VVYIQNRKGVNFYDLVLKHFNFLLEEYNFSVIEISDYKAEFSSKGVSVAVYHEKLSYEVYLTISLYGKTYYLNEVLDWKGVKEQQKVYQALNTQTVNSVLLEICSLFKQYCADIITLSKQDVEVVADILDTQRKNKQRISEHRALTSSANIAWKEKNYKRFVEIYEGYYSQLNDIQRKQLVYAKKKIESDSK